MLPRLAKEYGVTERTVERYYREIRELWKTEEKERRPERREEFRQALRYAYQRADDLGEPGAMVAALKVWAKLDGLEEPGKLDVSVSVDIRAMTPQQRQAEIDRLIAMRQAALGHKVVNGHPVINAKAIEAPKPKKRATKSKPKRKAKAKAKK